MTESEHADEFREAINKVPSRSFKPTKRQGGATVGVTTILAVLVALLRLATYHSHSRVDNTAYLKCIAQQEFAPQNSAGLGFPEPGDSFGVPGDITDPDDSAQTFGDAVSACSKYPH